jgi:long-chain fatty acid transport protein
LTDVHLCPHFKSQVEVEDKQMTLVGHSKVFGATALLLASTAIAHAGGVERNPQTTSILFEEGTYVELGYTYVSPDVSGTQVINAGATSLAGSQSGDVAPAYNFSSLAFRTDVNEQLSFALIIDEPIGANVDYAGLGAAGGYLYRLGSGSQAELTSEQLTLAARYEMPNGFSVYGGARIVSFEGEVGLFNGSGGGAARYTLSAEAASELGYMIGAAYERPDIAMRVALTYYSETEHNHPITNSLPIATGLGPLAATTGAYVLPQSVNLDFQTGIAEGTLLLASVRWAEWTETAINTQSALGIIDYDTDVWTWSAGIARRLTEDFAVVGRVTFEEANGFLQSNLDPKDGRIGLSLAGVYDFGDIRLTGGINYTHLGDATTTTINAPFTDNHAFGFGLRVGYSF